MTVRFDKEAVKELKKLNKSIQKRELSYMREIEQLDDPRTRGHALTGNLKGYWRYRVDDLWIICVFFPCLLFNTYDLPSSP